MEEYPEVLDAVRDRNKKARTLASAEIAFDNSNWKVGDSVLNACPPSENGVNNDSTNTLKDIAKYLEGKGIANYPWNTLRDLRDISSLYPAAERSAAVNWSVYRICRAYSDELLNWIKQFPDKGMTANEARDMVAGWKADEDAPDQPMPVADTPTDQPVAATGAVLDTTGSDIHAPQEEEPPVVEPPTTPVVVPHEEPEEENEDEAPDDDEEEEETIQSKFLREAEDSLALWEDISGYLKDNKEQDQQWLRDLGKVVVKLNGQLNNLKQLAVLKSEIKALNDKPGKNKPPRLVVDNRVDNNNPSDTPVAIAAAGNNTIN